jgi:hypothetical protein
MKWVPVESSAFSAGAYADEEHSLYLEFRSGEVYRYFDIPAQLYQEFLAADSHGRYFRRNILGRFRYNRIA